MNQRAVLGKVVVVNLSGSLRLALIRRAGFHLARSGLRVLGVKPLPAVLIMGHMRCGSTLLLHILLGNPACIGCGERNATYRTATDLDKLEIASRVAQRAFFRGHGMAVDQVNHDRFTPDRELLRSDRVRCILLVREPRATIQSLITLTRTYYEPWSMERVVDYYTGRLQTLARYANELPQQGKWLALTYDQLVDDTPATLGRLGAFLGLPTPLRENYALQSFTGKRGDPSPNIRAGSILRQRVTVPGEISGRELERALGAYRDCTRALQLDLISPI